MTISTAYRTARACAVVPDMWICARRPPASALMPRDA
ncbi:hypothetical protein NY99_19970 [Xanthomonas phaseoli pv. phaseoli]|uniref:Uncharacterized protein n=3 Tax=Xanthomonas axonopodis TaxID=53413 RepID=A0A1T1NVR3_9XANT|nr:hypothetical protein BGK55_02255 [Xanthomonas citri pv. malvacearum]KGU51825.1 hypothetical protein NY99_19970 [Xanthomonas phaseoli pv. phaseoli]OOW66623.1 hypothetical protein Xmar_08585 [Xanthomonas axonopodis pv. martyniicola]OOW67242.1 hypothetical protein Xmlh_18310 [Xanthomonas axonopodis pv. melhusii]OOW75967.1 hypothetical protein Xclt_04400 [Xanthomonas axonopodis pv. clitoriae]OOW99616.1 hypothetical protein Xkhy_09625 [Xanthomonas axonopodis pv. khayae]OOX17398.1 hypothetical p